MAVTATPVVLQTPKLYLRANSDGTLVTAGSNGTRVLAVWFTLDGTTGGGTQTLTLQVVRSGSTYTKTTVSFIDNSGNNGTNPTIDCLANWAGLPIDEWGQKYLDLQSGDTLNVDIGVALVTGNWYVAAVGGDF